MGVVFIFWGKGLRWVLGAGYNKKMRFSFLKGRGDWGWAFAVFVLAFVIYAPSVGYEYVPLDDQIFVYGNPLVVDGITVEALKKAFVQVQENYWAPLLWISYMADAQIGGLDPRPFHLTNVLLFALTSGLLAYVVPRWAGRRWAGLLIALLWVLHPARVESVAWITARKDVLSGVFFILGLGLYVEGRRGCIRHSMWWAWLCMALGGMAKPTVMVMPAAMVLLDIWPLRRTEWSGIWRRGWRLVSEKWAFWGLGVVLAALPIWIHVEHEALATASWPQRLSMIPAHYLFYLGKLIWPVGLMPLQPDLPFRPWVSLGGLLLLILLTWSLWRWRERYPWALMGWLWFVALLFPLTGVVWAGQERLATRFAYWPHLGLCLLAGMGVEAIFARRGWRRRWAVVICVLTSLAYLCQTQRLLRHWQDQDTFAHAVWTYHSAHETASLYGGDWLMRQGDWGAAEQAYGEGMMKGQRTCLGNVLQLRLWQGKVENAAEIWRAYEAELKMDLLAFSRSEMPITRSLLLSARGQILRAQGDYAGAIKVLQEALRGETSPAPFSLAEYLRACFEAGRQDLALAMAPPLAVRGMVIGAWKDLLPYYANFWTGGARGQAYAFFKEYAQRYPDDGMALNNMAWLLATAEPDGLGHVGEAEWPAMALQWAQHAMECGGEQVAGAWTTLAAARANAGDFSGALVALEPARRLAARDQDQALLARIASYEATYRDERPWREPDTRAERFSKEPLFEWKK